MAINAPYVEDGTTIGRDEHDAFTDDTICQEYCSSLDSNDECSSSSLDCTQTMDRFIGNDIDD